MTRQEAADAIRAKFPGVKVMFHEGLFNYGLAVELNGKRNAYAFGDDTPENWRDAADRLMQWLQGISE
jgi:hypothetical protein